MDEFRSKSCGDGRTAPEDYCEKGNPKPNASSNSIPDLRCYSASYASYSSSSQPQTQIENQAKFKKGKSSNASVSKNWGLGDPELQRKRRIAGYKVYMMEDKVKGSLKKSFRWVKNKVANGWR